MASSHPIHCYEGDSNSCNLVSIWYPANKISSGTRAILESWLVISKRISEHFLVAYSLEFHVFWTSDTQEIQNVSGTFSGHFLEWVKPEKFTSLLNMPLATFTILENLLCLILCKQLVIIMQARYRMIHRIQCTNVPGQPLIWPVVRPNGVWLIQSANVI